ncbi:MAG: S8 family serine peptidase [Ardenticatenaceae bacterium]|nr:S8 family serine peptidase [Ardenticatenaceae bacterium]
MGATDVWQTYGVRGEGAVVADNDTGVRWDHEALKAQYRGWDAATGRVNHDYAWHDAFGQYLAPYDDHGHGTHTTGTMVGDNEAVAGSDGPTRRQVGVAPGARWIACRNMAAGVGSPASYLDCFEWLLAPTRSDGSDSQPLLAPDIINNSWACTSGEGCTNDQLDVLESAAAAVRAAGILNVVAAGNEGNSQCGTVSDPPTIYPEVFSVGASNSANFLASFSSIGPVIRDGSQRFKPDLVAPGQSVVSSTSWSPSAYATSSGTSMATPAVSGVAALMLSAAPQLNGKVSLIERILRETAQPLTATVTIGHPTNACLADGSLHPNLLYGWGLVDARSAVAVARSCPSADFDGTGAVDVRDLALQAAAWHQPVDPLTRAFDLNQDNVIDIVDLILGSEEWLVRCQFPGGQ